MERSRNIFSWLGGKEEKEILNDALKHLEKSFECVEEMKESIDYLIKGDVEETKNHITRVKDAEHSGDEIRKRIMLELSKGMLFPPDREDLILLNESLNDIADSSKGVARLLEFLDRGLPEDFGKILLSDGIVAVRAGEQLKDAINFLIENNVEKVMEECAHIETLEEEGDDKRRELIGTLIKTDLQGAIPILLYEIIDTIEDVIDKIKKASDHIKILAIKSK